jgi:alpha-glucosidase
VIAVDDYLRFDCARDVQQTATGLRAALDGEHLKVDVVRPDVLRLAISRGGTFDESPTFAVQVDPLADVPAFSLERDEDEQVVRLHTDALVLRLQLEPFSLDVHRTDGSPVVETAVDEHGRPWPYATLNDAFVVRRRCSPQDAAFGLGEKTGAFDRRRRDFTMWNVDVLDPAASEEFTAGRAADDPRADRTSTEYDPYYVNIPFFHHQRRPSGAVSGSFVDNAYRGHYDFSAPDELSFHFAGGSYSEYVFAGPGMPDVLEAFTALTGRTGLPPLWTLGYHQCRWFRYTQDAVEAVGARHRELDVPCDSLWLDIEHMDGYRVFTWDDELFPDPAAMLQRLADDGFRVVTIVDPGVKHEPGYWVFDQARERDVLCRTAGGDVYLGQVWPGLTAFPDFANEQARRWWGALNGAHVRSGVGGIWNDMNEPATGRIPPDAMRFDRGREPHERYHNQYALLMAMATTAGLLEALPDRRPFVLSRAGFAGIQRVAATWMGDNQARWDHLAVSLPMAAGLGVSGQPFVGADVGGFQGDTDAELFLRWMQYGALTPFCRSHSEIGNVDQYVWSFGPVVQDLARAAIRLRYRLLPYLYTCFLQAAETGAPVQRPLVFDHQYDPLVAEIDDEYLLGRDLLVAPVLAPGTTSRQVYLPEGLWYDWHTDEVIAGPTFHVVPTPMHRIPLFARGGAVVALWPDVPPSTAGHHPGALELHLFVPGDDGTTHRSFVQEDDGVSFAATDGARYRTSFAVTRSGSRVRLEAAVDGQGYPEHARTELRLRVHGPAVMSLRVDGEDVLVQDGVARIENSGTGFSAEVALAQQDRVRR